MTPVLFVGPSILTRSDSAAVSDAVIRCLRTMTPSLILRSDRDTGIDPIVNLCASLLGVPQNVYSATGRIYGERRLMWRNLLKSVDSVNALDVEERDLALALELSQRKGRVVRFLGLATSEQSKLFELATKHGASFSVETLKKLAAFVSCCFF